MSASVFIANLILACSVMTYTIFPGQQAWQVATVLALGLHFMLGRRIGPRLRRDVVLLISAYFFIWALSAFLFVGRLQVGEIYSIPFNSILYPFTFVCGIWLGAHMKLKPELFTSMLLALFVLITFSAAVAYAFPSLPLCNARRPMMILPRDAACGIIDNPNYYSFCALALYAWYRLLRCASKPSATATKKVRRRPVSAIDWDLLALLGSSRMSLIALLAHKALGRKLVFPLVAFALVALIFTFSPSRLDFSIANRLRIWEFALAFLEKNPWGVFSPEIYSAEMLLAIGVDGEFQNSILGMAVIYGAMGVVFYVWAILCTSILMRKLPYDQRAWAIAILLVIVLNGVVRTHLPGGIGFLSLSCAMLLGFSGFRIQRSPQVRDKT